MNVTVAKHRFPWTHGLTLYLKQVIKAKNKSVRITVSMFPDRLREVI